MGNEGFNRIRIGDRDGALGSRVLNLGCKVATPNTATVFQKRNGLVDSGNISEL